MGLSRQRLKKITLANKRQQGANFDRAALSKKSRQNAREAVDQKKIGEAVAKDLVRAVAKAQKHGLTVSVQLDGNEAQIEVDMPRKGVSGLFRKVSRKLKKYNDKLSNPLVALTLTVGIAAATLGQSATDATAGYKPEARGPNAPHEMVLTDQAIEMGRNMAGEWMKSRLGPITGTAAEALYRSGLNELGEMGREFGRAASGEAGAKNVAPVRQADADAGLKNPAKALASPVQ